MAKRTRRAIRREKYRRARLRSNLIWGAIGLGVLIILGFLVWNVVRPAAGEDVPLMASRDHVPEGADPGPHNTDPPTSGPHYPVWAQAGFYEEAEMDQLGAFPEGYLIHNLEHGYVIFWYNCDNLAAAGCEPLKDDIRGIMEDFDNFKVIAVPWETIEEPVVMTSWGRMLRFDQFDADAARQFIERNRFRAPEPNAP